MKTIDADGHIVEKDPEIRRFLPEPFCRRGRPLLPSDGMDTGMGGRLGGLENNDVPTRLRDMDTEGIDLSVLFPTSSFAVSSVIERDYAIAYARAYNDFVADVCRQSPRLKAVALVPFQDPQAAVREAERAITKLGLAGVTIATQGLREHLGSQTFWPIYETLERLDVPLCVHNRRQGPAGEIRFDSFIFMHSIGRPVETFIQFAGMIYGGVPERFPKLRVAFLECGAGWVLYWMERLDEEWEKRGEVEAPLCRKKPSDYVKSGNWFFATEPEEEMLPYVIERIGDDKILFASDYPHWDGMFPRAVATIRDRKDLSEQTKARILGENAKRFYGWP
ncbi:MAG TPA: amidohydrolase family protein [candidate division Zixibacteria bacterium]|nr:amidohydrolase family protein [candidate division Zixibacteria bacterium]